MSTIKNLVKTFKDRERQTDVKIQEELLPVIQKQSLQVAELPVVAKIELEQDNKPVVNKDNNQTKQKVKTEKNTTVTSNKREKKTETIRTNLTSFNLSDDFFASLNEQTFSYEKSKFAYIDKKIYEILMTLKRKKDVKNISILINAALSQFIENNKDEIKTIFMDDLL